MGKKIRHVGTFEFNHPIIHFVTVKPMIWIGRVWVHILVGKHHLWAMASPAPLRRLMYFGPASHPLHSRPAPILVNVGHAPGPSRPEVVEDTELSTEQRG
jgi:hypothetical protein